jgi:hypothetical protein
MVEEISAKGLAWQNAALKYFGFLRESTPDTPGRPTSPRLRRAKEAGAPLLHRLLTWLWAIPPQSIGKVVRNWRDVGAILLGMRRAGAALVGK